MLEKDKNYIEFSMRSMIIARKPYQEDIEIEVTGMIPGREILTADNSFYVPCEVVMVPKREFERLQTENEELKQKLHEFDPMPDYKKLLEKLYSVEDVEKLEWTLNHICGGRGSVNGWIAVSSFWKQNYETLSKLVGFSSIEEIQDYLTNEANCDTLHEAMLKLINENKYVCEEWCKAGELIEKWRETTGCPSPSSAKTLIESGASYEHGYHEVQEEKRKLTEEVDSWKNVTGYSTPEDYMHARINCATPFDYTAVWQDATGCVTPDQAKSRIEGLENAVRLTDTTLLGELEREIDAWQKATGRISPEEAKQYIGRLKSRLNLIHDCAVDW